MLFSIQFWIRNHYIAVIILSVCILHSQAQWWRPKWRALILEGGGDKGAYQVGGIRGLVESLDPSEVQYFFASTNWKAN